MKPNGHNLNLITCLFISNAAMRSTAKRSTAWHRTAWHRTAWQGQARRCEARQGRSPGTSRGSSFYRRRVAINITTECAAIGAVRGPRGNRKDAIHYLSSTVHSPSRGRDNKHGGFTTRMSCGLFLTDSYEPSAEGPRVLWLTIRAHRQSTRGKNTDGGDSKCDARRAVRTLCHPGRTDAACTRNSAIGHVVARIGAAKPAWRPDGNGCPAGLCIIERFRKIA